MPTPTATWNPARGVWETTAVSLCGHSEVFSATWPTSGTTRRGVAYELPTWEPPTAGSECSSSPGLPTPRATRGGSGTETMYALGGELTDEDLPQGQVLLPTPTTADGMGGPGNSGRDGGLNLRTAAAGLLPTPKATDGTNGGPNQRGSSEDLMLPSAVNQLLPTPIAADSQGGPRALPERRTASGPDHGPQLRDLAPTLLPTPTATPYGNNQSPSPGAAVRPSLDSLALTLTLMPTPTARELPGDDSLPDALGRLLPTPIAGDAKATRNATSGRQQGSQHHTGYTLTDVLVPPPGGLTPPPSPDGSQ